MLQKKSGGSAEGLQQSVRSLSKDLYQFAETGSSRAEPFLKSFGIAMKDANGKAREVFDVLPDIAQAMEGMSKQEAIGFGQKIGLDNGTIMLLQQGKQGLDDLIKRQKELGGVSKEDAETAEAFNDALDDTAHAFRSIYMGIATAILPAFTWVLQKVQQTTQFIREHKTFFVGTIAAIGTALALYYTPQMYRAAAATIAATWPFILIGAAIAAAGVILGLIIEDIYAFLKGGDSLIGQLSTKWPIIGKVIYGIRDAFIWLFGAADKVISFFSNMWNNPKQALDDFKLFLKTAWDDFINSVPLVGKALDTIVAIFNAAIAGIKATIEAVTGAIQKTKDTLSVNIAPSGFNEFDANTSDGYIPENVRKHKEKWDQEQAAKKLQQAQAQTSTITTMTSDSITNSTSNRSNVINDNSTRTVNITTGADAGEVRKAVKDEISSQSKTAMQKLDDGESH